MRGNYKIHFNYTSIETSSIRLKDGHNNNGNVKLNVQSSRTATMLVDALYFILLYLLIGKTKAEKSNLRYFSYISHYSQD